MNRDKKGVLLGWASCNFAAARRELIQGVITLDEAGFAPSENLAATVDDLLWLDEIITGLADEYAANVSALMRLPGREAA